MVKEIIYKVDINTLHRIENDKTIQCNDIARVSIRTTHPLFVDSYNTNRNTGSVIIIITNKQINIAQSDTELLGVGTMYRDRVH